MMDSILFNNLLDNVDELIYFKDTESRFIRISKSMAERFGLECPDDAIGKTDFDFFEEHHANEAYQDEQKILNTGKPILNKVQKEFLKNPDRIAWSTVSKFPLYNENGEISGTYGISIDITKEKEISEKLEQSHQDFRMLSKQIPGFFYIFERPQLGKNYIPFASSGIEEVFEIDADATKKSIEPIFERLHPDDLISFKTSLLRASMNMTQWEHEFRVILPTKGLRWMRGRANPEQRSDGVLRGYGYITDITEEKKSYQDIARLREQLQQVVDSAPNLIFIKDIEGKYLMVNKSAAKFHGKTPKEIIGMKDVDLGLSKQKSEHFLKIDNEVVNTNESYFIPEVKTIRPDGSEVWHQTIKVPFLNTDSGKPAVLSIVTDITELKQNELELSHSLNIISEQNKRLMNFAHIVSHNLRNHAGNISMLLSLYNMEDSQEEKDELLGHLNTASERLNESISDLNEIIDNQYNTDTDKKYVDLNETLKKVKEILSTERVSNNVVIEETIPNDLTLKYNSSYLESILLNLLSNAIKYRHPDRQPVIEVKAHKNEDTVFLEVTDNGVGLDLEQHGDKLFGMYHTFHDNEDSKGIGLYITKNQIESMGGSIKVDSEPGKGTTFKIQLL